MKQKNFIISLIIACTLFFSLSSLTFAQGRIIPKSLGASVTQTLGVDTDITINYCRAGVKGRKIWGGLEPYGLSGKNKDLPWRAGANATTTIEFNNDIEINGKKLTAGKYGLFMIIDRIEWTVIFSKLSSGHGSDDYKKENDALRIKVTPVKVTHQEWLVYGFEKLAGTSATAFLMWEEIKIPFAVKVSGD